MRCLRRAHQKYLKEQNKKRNRFRQKALAAGTVAAIAFGTGTALNMTLAVPPLSHLLPVADDNDGDLLTQDEELAIGSHLQSDDQNVNAILDGIELANNCANIINQLPWEGEQQPGQIYKIGHMTYGLESCDICGLEVNMGNLEIVNPNLGLTSYVNFIALHYLEHGSFSFAGTEHDGRCDVPQLLQTLEIDFSYDPNTHQQPVPSDSDSDLLSDREETSIGYQPFNSDQNKNQILDGVELARRCAAAIDQLLIEGEAGPNDIYFAPHECYGLERCHICGQIFNMCGIKIFNPKLGMSYPDPTDPLDEDTLLPFLALHYMEHGSFDCVGDVHNGRVDIDRLLRVLEMHVPAEPNDHQLPLNYKTSSGQQLATDTNDTDLDLLADGEEMNANFNLYDADQDGDLALDGVELAEQCKLAIYDLPDGPQPDPNQPYKILLMTDGLETCEVCGLTIPMDYWEITNPRLGLLINIPVMAAHYMEHGSFSYDATEHQGRIDIPLLLKILEMPQQCGDLGTVYRPGDANKDCKVDGRDFAYFADQWLKETYPQND